MSSEIRKRQPLPVPDNQDWSFNLHGLDEDCVIYKIRQPRESGCLILLRAEDGTQTRDPQLGRLMLYRLSYFRKIQWAKMDSNHRRRKPADLQSAPFGHSGTCPYRMRNFTIGGFVSQLRCKGNAIFLICKQNQSFLLHQLHIRLLYCPIFLPHALRLAACYWWLSSRREPGCRLSHSGK